MKEIKINGDTVSPEAVTDAIKEVTYTKLGKKITVCHITLVNGYELIGMSGVVNPDNYNAEIGNPIAYKKAEDKVWEHLGTILQNQNAAYAEWKDRNN